MSAFHLAFPCYTPHMVLFLKTSRLRGAYVLVVWIAWCLVSSGPRAQAQELNKLPAPDEARVVAIVGGRLLDGHGGDVTPDSVVIVRGSRIVATGARDNMPVPAEAELVDAAGMTVLPGLIDAHFHKGGDPKNDRIARLFLAHGVTSLRDPGAWIERFRTLIEDPRLAPRLFLTGPHLDTAPPAYPHNSWMVNDPEEGRRVVDRFVDQGASAIKVYYRLPLGTIRAVCEAAHARGVPVTAHLELVDARDAIRAGLDGIEHVTSFGVALAEPMAAERFRQAVTADNNARREGRYELWSKIDLYSDRVRELIDLIVKHGVFVSPNLAVFERQGGDKGATEMHVQAFSNMMRFIGMAASAGARIVVGSHTWVPHAELGWAINGRWSCWWPAG